MKKSISVLMFLGLAASLTGASTAHASDAVVLAAGYGDRTSSLRAGHVRPWNKQWFTEGNWHLTGYWESNVGLIKSDAKGGKTLLNVGFTPVFRFRPNASGGAQPYWEAAVGAQLYSGTTVNDERSLGNSLLLAEHLGFGFTFGDKTRYDVGYRLQHASNAGLQRSSGLTQHQVRLTYLY
jgi:lipid A 3-O-deacylase